MDCPLDIAAPAYVAQEYSLELMNFYPTHEAYLAQFEAESWSRQLAVWNKCSTVFIGTHSR
eukprot:12927814-Prorocentrum_lima.AAC.1